jgi:hypothetical protein
MDKLWAWAAVLLVASAAAGGAALAQEPAGAQWEPIGEAQGVQFALNLASVARTGDTATFQVRLDGQPQGVAARHVMIIDSSFDCAGRSVTASGFRPFDADGRLLESREIPAAERPTERLSARVPIYAALFQRVCGTALPE